MAKGREHFALEWIKGELFETLNDARESLEAYVESDRDETRMRACLTGLHQVHGTLVMLELSGVTMLADHLERAAQEMLNGFSSSGTTDAEAMESAVSQTLMQGILELPGHIEEIQRGAPDTPNAVLHLVNELRNHLGEDPIASGADVTEIAGASDVAVQRFEGIEGVTKARKIRAAYQQVLLSILKGDDLAGAVGMLTKVAQGLRRICEGTPSEIQWQAFSEFVVSLKGYKGALQGDAVKLLRRVDSEIRTLAQDGAQALKRPVSRELIEQMLSAAEQHEHNSEAVQSLRNKLSDNSRPNDDGLTISGRQALASAAASLREELVMVKDSLDLIVRADNQSSEDLSALIAPLKQIGSTLSLLGFESSKTIVKDQVEVLSQTLEGELLDQPTLLSVASALVQVDENLASFTQGGKGEVEKITDDAQRAVTEEARSGLEEIKQQIVDFISSQFDPNHLNGSSERLATICGALDIIPLPRASRLLALGSGYMSREFTGARTPTWEELDHLADAISGVDYYLERMAAPNSVGAEDILDLVERSLTRLGVNLDVVASEPDSDSADRPGEPIDLEAPLDVPVAETTADETTLEDGLDDLDAILQEPVPSVDDASEGTGEAGDIRFEEARGASTTETLIEPESVSMDGDDDDNEPELATDDDAGFDLDNTAYDGFDSKAVDDQPMETPAEEVKSVSEAELGEEPDSAADSAEAPISSLPSSVSKPSLIDTFESDEEIVEIFAEEVSEVLEAVGEWLPQWALDLSNEEALTEIRRAFHTLKGSGRIVGANIIGEMGWSVENMLNRLIDGTVEPSAEFISVVEEARALAPELRDAYETRTVPDMGPLATLMERADVLASGGTLDDRPGESSNIAEPAVPASEEEQDDSLDIFIGEANQHLAVLLAAATEDGFSVDDNSLRALHTLSGSAGMSGIAQVADLARPTYELALKLRGDAARVATGESGDFVKRAVAALGVAVADLQAGRTPEDQLQLIAEADDLMIAAGQSGTDEVQTASDVLMGLEGLSVIMEASDYLVSWRDGAMDLEYADQLTASLAEVGQVAQETGRERIARLAAALGAAHEHLAHDLLSEEQLEVLDQGHERLLSLFDALAADQDLEQVDDVVAQLGVLATSESQAQSAGEDDRRAVQDVPVVQEPVDEDLIAEVDAVAESANEANNIVSFPKDNAPATAGGGEFSLEELEDDFLKKLSDESRGPVPPRPTHQAAKEKKAGEEKTDQARVQPLPQADREAGVPLDPAFAGLLPEDIDEEIIEVFFEEAAEILEELEENIHQWSSEPENRLYLEHMLRGLHTLKGGARLSGFTTLGDATHQFESFLIELQGENKLADAAAFSTLHERFDGITNLLVVIRKAMAGEPVQVPDSGVETAGGSAAGDVAGNTLLAAVDESATGADKSGEAEDKHVPILETAVSKASDTAAVVPQVSKSADDTPSEQAAPADTSEQKASQEMVRVGSQLLEKLVNLAGESSIIRARVEQGMSDFTSALDEMETTIERVREQLRRLEIETEAQILFRQDRPSGPSYADFDPLEMDRYSQLQQLSRGLTESASDMLDLKETLLFKARESETLLLQQARINTELQEGLMRTRMVPFSRLLPRLRRIVRQVSEELGKDVEFHAYNTEGELDRNLLERMVPPLEHMLRNAVDHGIESAELRKNFGKPPAGRIDLRLSREGGDVVIEISDDGAGIDVETVRAKAVERGLMDINADLKDEEISQFVLAPGFSTATSVTQISGRGVGMDVVHREVKQLGGSIQISSRAGAGTRFNLRVPFTVSVNRALMVLVGEDPYAIPLNNIEGIVLLSPEELERLYAPEGNTFEYAGIPYRMRYLGHYLGREFRAASQQTSVPVVLVRSGDHAVAVHVDAVQGSREIVVKSLGPQFAGVGGISGATIMGDGSVVVILDLLALIRAQAGDGLATGNRSLTGAARTRCVMVVDDSVTVRKVTSRLLERQGMDVLVAKDGVEAVALLQERKPDVMLLDIEMPRMDGFEVARQVRHDERLKDLPIIMISSRTGEKHQEHAAQLGVNSFLGKPFQENELLATIDRLVD